RVREVQTFGDLVDCEVGRGQQVGDSFHAYSDYVSVNGSADEFDVAMVECSSREADMFEHRCDGNVRVGSVSDEAERCDHQWVFDRQEVRGLSGCDTNWRDVMHAPGLCL